MSSTVVKVRDLLVGMGVLRGTTTPKTSPCMATPRESGAEGEKVVNICPNMTGWEKGRLTDIEEEEVGSLLRRLTGEDGGLDGGSVGDSLVGVDRLVEGAATEELGDEGLDLRDTGGSTDEDNVVNLGAVHLGVLKDLLDRVEGGAEGDGVDLLEAGTRDGGGEVGSLRCRRDSVRDLQEHGEKRGNTPGRGSRPRR